LDKVIKSATLETNGFEDSIGESGRIGVRDHSDPMKYDVKSSWETVVKIPNTIASSPYFTLKMFAKPLDSILDAIESLIRDPFGCFEQTSSTTYPMVMAL